MRVSFKGKHRVNTTRVNNCFPRCLLLFTLKLKTVYPKCLLPKGVNKQGGIYIIYPCLPRVFTLMNGQGGQSVRFLQNNANYNASLASRYGESTSESSGLLVL